MELCIKFSATMWFLLASKPEKTDLDSVNTWLGMMWFCLPILTMITQERFFEDKWLLNLKADTAE